MKKQKNSSKKVVKFTKLKQKKSENILPELKKAALQNLKYFKVKRIF